eukprot:scaffold882_cov384-Pavlova_lutheri.AAC.4
MVLVSSSRVGRSVAIVPMKVWDGLPGSASIETTSREPRVDRIHGGKREGSTAGTRGTSKHGGS